MQKKFLLVVIKGDAKACVEAIVKPNVYPNWQLEEIIDDIKNMVSDYKECSFRRDLLREVNKVAHELNR